jgi:hypothetical protein
MHLHQGKAGGPDCSGATDVAQCAPATAQGLRKFVATPAHPGEFKLLTNVLGAHFTEMVIAQEENAHCEFGFCGPDGNIHAPYPHAAASPGPQGRVMLYAHAKPGVSRAVYEQGANCFWFKSLDGKPLVFTVNVGPVI